MPRVGEPTGLTPIFPWEEWQKQLQASPTRTLFFGEEDFGPIQPRRFRDIARQRFKNARVAVRGDEVMVTLDA
jgi:hypothetical protein